MHTPQERNENPQVGILKEPRNGIEKTEKNILHEADNITSGSRNQAYGHPADNFENIAELWNAYIAIKLRMHPSNVLEPSRINLLNRIDIANLNILQKVARLATNPLHYDSKVDIAGYARTQEMIVDFLRDQQAGDGRKS